MTLNLTNEDRLLPERRVPSPVLPVVGRGSRAAKGGNDLHGGISGKLF